MRHQFYIEFVEIGASAELDVVTDGPHNHFAGLDDAKAFAFHFFRTAQTPQWMGARITGFRIKDAAGNIIFRWTWDDEREHERQEALKTREE